jgi:WD40 repeat protein/serine/threonine protein kinase
MKTFEQEVQSIFGWARECATESERKIFLDEACRGNAALRERVEALLRAHAEAGGFLDAAPDSDPTVKLPVSEEEPGALIGPYKLLQEIGEGGMGRVFMAEQTQPVQRKVALKIIKAGMDSRQVIARFEAERQALALMDHPNIAKVLDAGTTADGRPFFVMELVKGVPITQYCDERRLTPRQRLELFVPVCQGVQHAHQKGIIHRDIKPANVLVAEYDHVAVPKIIDFGVAKAIGQPLTDKTMFTRFGQIVGTIDYMSPEQAKLNQLDIDTRSDIYALGVLLYELLTGATPFDRERLRTAAWDEMLRIIREEEPPTPSRRLSSSQSLPSVAASRQMEPKRLTTLVRGELDWIVMKCLEKDRNRRYETAEALATDVQRHLRDEPVLACPPTAAYRVRKFVRRHRGPVVATTAVFVVLVLGIIGTSLGLVGAVNAQRKATAERETARRERDDKEVARASERSLRELAESQKSTIQRHLYAADTARVRGASASGRFSAFVEDLLDATRPDRTGGEDLRGWEWYRIHKVSHSETVRYRGHVGTVYAAAFTADGSRVASADDSGAVIIWNAATGDEVKRLQVAEAAVLAVAFSPDGTQLAVACQDGTAAAIDTTTWRPLHDLRGHLLSVTAVAYSLDGQLLATAGADNAIMVWDARDGSRIATLVGHEGEVRRLWFESKGKRLASFGDDGTVRFWNTDDGSEGSGFGVRALTRATAVSADLTRLVGWFQHETRGERLFLIDLERGVPVTDFPDYRQPVRDAAFSPDGKRLAIVDTEGGVAVWDLQRRRVVFDEQGGALAVAFSADGERIACIADDNSVKVWPAESGREGRFRGHDGWLTRLAVHSQGKLLASGDTLGSIRLWDLANGETVRTFGVHIAEKGPEGTPKPDALRAMEGKPVRHRLEFVPPADGVYAPNTVRRVWVYEGHGGEITSLAFAPDGRTLGSAGANTAQVWDVETGASRHVLDHPQRVSNLAFSPDGSLVATGCWDDAVRLWDVKEGVERFSLRGHRDDVEAVLFLDGRRIASAGSDGVVRIWDLAKREVVKELQGHNETVYSLALSPDGRLLASGSKDRTIRLWEVETGSLHSVLLGHTGRVTGLLFLPERDRLVSISSDEDDGMLRVWDVKTGRELVAFPPPHERINSVAFDAIGRRLAVTEGSYLRLWEASSPSEAAPLVKPAIAPQAPPGEAMFADDGGPRVLGRLRAAELLRMHAAPGAPLKPGQADHEFVIVILSVPHGSLFPSPSQFEQLQERHRQAPDEYGGGPRDSYALYDPSRFKLVAEGGGGAAVAAIGPLPFAYGGRTPGGFSTRTVVELSTATFAPTERALVAVAWEVPTAEADGPLSIQFDSNKPVAVPGLRLDGYSGMHHSGRRPRPGETGSSSLLVGQSQYSEF